MEPDLTGIIEWRLQPEDNFSNADKKVYSARDSVLGKRLRLSISVKAGGTISELEFRRFDQCPCKRNDDGHAAGYCTSRRGGFYNGGIVEDVWN